MFISSLNCFVFVWQEGSCISTIENYCDFESANLCGYYSDPTADFWWERKRGPSDTSGTGPANGDHTTDSDFGHYMATGINLISIL